ncbi:MAG: hypothetical protein KF842_06930 [Caulobacter sp.]|nr:hypothetical protein [Caulobacter sp.]
MSVPPQGRATPSSTGLTCWKATFTTLTVGPVKDGLRRLTVATDGEIIAGMELDAEAAAALAALLTGEAADV